jgi:hypothetical protein
MIHTTMWTYPWDVMDEGVERVLGTLKEEVGLDAISLATVYHTYDELRTHMPGKKLYSGYEDAIYFQPRLELYADTQIKPKVHPMAAEQNPVEIIAEACAARGLELISWTVPLHTQYLARKHPDCALLGAFGDRYPGCLCPAHPQVREYVRALSRDLDSNYNLQMIEYESLHYMGFGMFRNHGKVGVDLGPAGQLLMSLCFCEHCTERAGERGMDAGQVKVRAEKLLLDIFEDGPLESSVEEFVPGEPLVDEYVKMRADTVTSLATEVREAIKAPISFLYMGNYYNNGIERKSIEPVVERVNVLCYSNSPEQAAKTAADTLAGMADPAMLICGLNGHNPIGSAALMREIITAVYETGARRFSYYNYGMISRRNLRWIAEAIAAVRALDA